jgi:hypothetical protein
VTALSTSNRNQGGETVKNGNFSTRFKPGNPGRPKGTRNKRSVLVEVLMTEDAEAITKSVIAAAKGGDMAAARLILERIAPTRKGRPVEFQAPTNLDAHGLAEAFGSLLQETASGSITPEEALAVANVLEMRRRALELEATEIRLKSLEAALEEMGTKR